MRNLGAGIVCLLCLVAVAGCTTNKSIANVNFTTQATLELAVGTLNDSASTLGIGGTSLNAVASFRNQFGNSAYLNPGTATLAGPTISGPITDTGNGCQGSGLFSYGQLPGTNGVVGAPPTYSPPNSNGVGYATGFLVRFIGIGSPIVCSPTALGPVTPGAYTLATIVSVNGVNTPYQATATLPASPTVLPNDGGVLSFTTDNLGGGTFTINVPGGVTESLIIVVSGGSTVASIKTTTASATITGTGSSCTGASPSGVPIPCGGFSVFVVGADYPLVEAGPPANTQPNPTLTGAGGTSNLTVSATNSSFSE